MFSWALIGVTFLATAAAALSVIVVLRHWAFIGEGIGHAGFGGAGTAWLLSPFIPAFATPAGTLSIAVAFCLATALAIAFVSRQRRVHVDTAIGIFLVAAIAWGFVAQGVYSARLGAPPPDWHDYLVGRLASISGRYALAAALTGLGVLIVLLALGKEILSYCLDPQLAEVSGVRAGLIHYLLILLMAVTIVLGLQITGPLLVPALLILPGASALQMSRRLRAVFVLAMSVGLSGAVGGLLANRIWPFLPAGPMIVLVLFAMFVLAYTAARVRGK